MINRIILLFLLVGFSIPNFAQSDYQYLQEFKSGVRKIEQKIKKAKTPSDFKKIEKDIFGFYSYHKMRQDFLDKALYPKSFDSEIEMLKKKLSDAKKKNELYSQTIKLEKEVSQLQNSLNTLSSGYYASFKIIDSLKSVLTKNSKQQQLLIAKYKELKKNLNERNALISNLLDSLLIVNNTNSETPDQNERLNYLNIESANIIDGIINLINDNINYLKINRNIQPDEFVKLLKEEKLFSKNFNKIPNTLWENWLGDNLTVEEFKQKINSLSDKWETTIEKAIVFQLQNLFTSHNIQLDSAQTFDNFFQLVIDYAEKKSIEAGTYYERLHNYKVFVDTLWNKEFMQKWATPLEQAGLLSANEIIAVQTLNADWKDRLDKKTPIFLYLIISFIMGTILIYIVTQAKRNKFKRLGKAKKKKKEYEKMKKQR